MNMISLSKLTKSVAIAALMALPLFASFTGPAQALQSDHKRFAQCKALKSAGSFSWQGIASGVIDDVHSVFDHSESFHAKACFASQKECNTWVKRIWWEIPEMNELRTAYCKPA